MVASNTEVWRSECGDFSPRAAHYPRFAQTWRMSPRAPTSAPERRSGKRSVSRWRATMRTGDLTHTEAHTGDRMDGDGAISQSASPSSSVSSRQGTASLTALLQCHMRGIRGARAISSACQWCAREESNLYLRAPKARALPVELRARLTSHVSLLYLVATVLSPSFWSILQNRAAPAA
jgi:hypothetical protein